jgi:hypothetical protein
MHSGNPRRQFFRMLLHAGLLLMGAGITACRGRIKTTDEISDNGSSGSCDDLAGLSDQDLKLRETFGYLPKSPVAGNQCSNCNLWLPNEADLSCGKCLLFKGPVYAVGHCTSWAPQT